MGALSASTPLSDRIRMETPRATASDAARRSLSIAARSPPFSSGSNSVESVSERMPLTSMARIFSRSALVMNGSDTDSWRQCSGVSENRSRSAPIIARVDVINSSRIESSGGLDTCANRWRK